MAASLPCIDPCHYSSTLQIAADALNHNLKTRFDVIKLFDIARGSKWIQTPKAKQLWLDSFCSSSHVTLGYNGARNTTKIGPKRTSASVHQKGQMPDAPKPNKVAATNDLLKVISTDVLRKTYIGPFTLAQAKQQFEHFVCSSIFGIEDSTRSTTKIRLIHNLSSRFFSVNKNINSKFNHALDYTSVFFAAMNEMMAMSDTVWFGCLDVSRGYKRFLTHPKDIALQGLSIPICQNTTVPSFDGTDVGTCDLIAGEDYYWFETSMPFGSKSAPASFCAVSIAVRDLVRELGTIAGIPGTLLVYVDDYCCLAPTEQSAWFYLGTLRSLLTLVKLPEEPSKAQNVSTTVRYLGIDYDGVAHTATLPKPKRDLYVRYLKYFLASRRVLKSHLDSMVHRLRHAASVLRAGKPFFLNLLNTLRGCHHQYVKLSKQNKEDIIWWIHILEHVQPKVIIGPSHWSSLEDLNIYTDASKQGYGAFYNGRYFNGEFTKTEKAAFETFEITINEFELLIVVFAISTWAPLLAGKRITFHCDNSASVASITNEKSRIAVRIAMLRHLYAIAILHSIDLRCLWIGTKANVIADSLSRFAMSLFLKITKNKYNLRREPSPALAARSLLLDPAGPQNPCSPDWRP